ncbi:hypothetical protein L6R50_05230 [Myxococcota bacterium]|nr:hypothetical protein [Myxococcota bacterium]
MHRPSPGTVPWALAGLLAVLAPAAARAHGDLPQSTDVVFEDPSDPLPLVLTTFGVLVPRAGDDWEWVCEDVVGSGGISDFEALPSGTWLFGTAQGLWRSVDRCSWERVGGAVEDLDFTQVSRDVAEPDVVWAATASGGRDNALWRSGDGGSTFAAFASFGEGSTVRGFLQGPDGASFWVFGWRDLSPWLWRSEDGLVFDEHPLQPMAPGTSVYPLGLDPADPSVAYVALRVLDPPHDELGSVAADGTIEALLEVPDEIVAFAAGPEEGRMVAGGRYAGLYATADGGATWSGPDDAVEAGCLVDRGGVRYRCTHPFADGASVMAALAGGGELQPVQDFADVCRPYECPAGTEVAEVCGPLWEATREEAGLCLGEAEQETPAPDPGCDGGGCAAAGGAEPGAGTLAPALLLGLRRRAPPASPRAAGPRIG